MNNDPATPPNLTTDELKGVMNSILRQLRTHGLSPFDLLAYAEMADAVDIGRDCSDKESGLTINEAIEDARDAESDDSGRYLDDLYDQARRYAALFGIGEKNVHDKSLDEYTS